MPVAPSIIIAVALYLLGQEVFTMEMSMDRMFSPDCLGSNFFHEFIVLSDEDPVEAGRKIASIGNPSASLSMKDGNVSNSLVTQQRPSAIVVTARNLTLLKGSLSKLLPQTEGLNYFYFIRWYGEFAQLSDVAHNLSSLMPVNSDVYWVDEESLVESYSIKKTVTVSQKLPLLQVICEDSMYHLVASKWRRRRNLQSLKIVATAVDDDAYREEVRFSTTVNGQKRFADSLAVDVFRIFCWYLNLTESLVEGEYMLEEETLGSPDQMQAQLVNGDADVSITSNTMSAKKAAYIRFLHPTYGARLELRFLERRSVWRFLVRPFAESVWLLTFIYALVMAMIVSFYRRIVLGMRYSCEAIHVDLLWILSTLCLQGWYDWPQRSSLRVIFLVASATGFLLNAAYSGALTSQLSVKQPSEVTLEMLLDLKYDFYIEEDVGFPVDFDAFPRWRGLRLTNIVNMELGRDAVDKITRRNAAFISFPEYFHAIMETTNRTVNEACNFCTTLRLSTPSICGMAVSKASELKEFLNILILMARERGILRRLFILYKQGRILSCDFDSMGITPQRLFELYLAYAVLFGGAAMSVVILMIEILIVSFPIRKLPRRL